MNENVNLAACLWTLTLQGSVSNISKFKGTAKFVWLFPGSQRSLHGRRRAEILEAGALHECVCPQQTLLPLSVHFPKGSELLSSLRAEYS